jgi:DsbC/DsbD-like thiol-disulfide interchange protein
LLKNLFISIGVVIAASSASASHTETRLILANEMVLPGDTVLAGIELHMDPQWHTFWKNAGAFGIPTSIQWAQSWTVTAGDTQWPVPEKFLTNALASYGYKDDVILLVPLKIAYGVPQGPIDLKATVSWQEFKEQGISGSAEVHATLSIGRQNRPSANAELLLSSQAKLPQSGATLSARAWWEGASTSDVRQVILEWTSPQTASEADFFPYGSQSFEVQGATERIPAEDGKIRLRKQIKKLNGDWPGEVSGLLIEKTVGKQRGFEVTLPILEAPR